MPPATRLSIQADLPKVLSMVQALAAHHGDTATVTHETPIRDTGGLVPWITLIVAEENGALLVYAALCPLILLQYGARGLDLHHLFVAPNSRGMGVREALIDASVAHARDVECGYLTVGTDHRNAKAAQTYLAAGFEPLLPPGPRFRMKFEA